MIANSEESKLHACHYYSIFSSLTLFSLDHNHDDGGGGGGGNGGIREPDAKLYPGVVQKMNDYGKLQIYVDDFSHCKGKKRAKPKK